MTNPRFALRDPFLWIAILLISGMLGWLSVARYEGFNAGMYDLGNMAQAIWSGARGEPLLYSRPEVRVHRAWPGMSRSATFCLRLSMRSGPIRACC